MTSTYNEVTSNSIKSSELELLNNVTNNINLFNQSHFKHKIKSTAKLYAIHSYTGGKKGLYTYI